MYTLIAEAMSPAWSGEIARESFASIEEAETKMKQWARFGVDSYCNEADTLRIIDESEVELSRWNWRQRKPVAAETSTRLA